jgi:UPF0716 family protein affecting phage T7 exclusion
LGVVFPAIVVLEAVRHGRGPIRHASSGTIVVTLIVLALFVMVDPGALTSMIVEVIFAPPRREWTAAAGLSTK